MNETLFGLIRSRLDGVEGLNHTLHYPPSFSCEASLPLAFSCTSLKSCDIARDVYKRAFSWGVTMSTSFYSFLFDDMECRVDPLPLTTLVYLS